MRNMTHPPISAYPHSASQGGDGMGDVRVFWLAAAIAILAVVAVVAFKLNGPELRASLFGNVAAFTQPVAAPSAGSLMPGRDLALQTGAVTGTTAR